MGPEDREAVGDDHVHDADVFYLGLALSSSTSRGSWRAAARSARPIPQAARTAPLGTMVDS